VKNPNQVRQGDVLLELIGDSLPPAMQALSPDNDGSVTLAHGEVTGHRHRFVCHADGGSDAISYAHPVAPTEPARVQILAPAALLHEEHGAIEISKGIVRISRPYEYAGTELPRRVED
jgi:hypothetical protein